MSDNPLVCSRYKPSELAVALHFPNVVIFLQVVSIFCYVTPMKAWQRSQVGSRTVEQSNRGRWARRTLRRSPKPEHWRQQTATGDSDRFRSGCAFHLFCDVWAWVLPFCAQQVRVRVFWRRPGRPAALFVQLGGGAREGAAAGGEPASRQRVCPLYILWRRCPGPKVKTIPSCTSLPTHSCTVTIIFIVSFGILCSCWFFC